MRVKRNSNPFMSHLGERPDNVVNVATRAEIALVGQEHHRIDIVRIDQRPERIAQLGITLERQRVLALRLRQTDRQRPVPCIVQ